VNFNYTELTEFIICAKYRLTKYCARYYTFVFLSFFFFLLKQQYKMWLYYTVGYVMSRTTRLNKALTAAVWQTCDWLINFASRWHDCSIKAAIPADRCCCCLRKLKENTLKCVHFSKNSIRRTRILEPWSVSVQELRGSQLITVQRVVELRGQDALVNYGHWTCPLNNAGGHQQWRHSPGGLRPGSALLNSSTFS